ncbi:hypothetical protein N9S07_00900 [Nitrosomonadales bacterium]|jgi:hypothetical protein|nr:hypothetical protein [Nitrosomonadales bacterium]
MRKICFFILMLLITNLYAMEIKTSSTFYFESFDNPKPEVEDCSDVNVPAATGGNAMTSPGQMFIRKSICQTQKNTADKKVPTDKKAIFLSHEKVKKEIWKKYLNEMQPEKLEQLDLAFSKDSFNFNDYLSDCVFVKDIVKKDEGTITSVARCNINESILNKELKKKSAAGQTTSGEGSDIAYFIAMRKAEERLVKNDDIVFNSKRTDNAASETVSIDDDGEGQTTISSRSSKIEKGKIDGGTRRTKSDEISYIELDIDPAVVDGAFNEVFSRYNFETTDYGLIDCNAEEDILEYEDLTEEFVDRNKLKKKTLRQARNFVKDCGFKYFVVGSITIDSKSNVNNNVQVNASMSTQVYLLGKRTKNVASTSNQLMGEGKNEIEAARQAIKNLANETAEIIAAKLNVKGIN